MTLLISACTKDHIILASDRRLAYVDHFGNISAGDEDACKLIYFSSGYLFAYTGPAQLGKKRTRTDIWISQSLEGVDRTWNIYEILIYLAKKLEADISLYRNDRYKYMTIVALGWERSRESPDLDPCLGVISTYLDYNFNQVPLRKIGNNVFAYCSMRRIFRGNTPYIFYAGQSISQSRKDRLHKIFREFNKRNLSQEVMINTLHEEIVFSSEKNPWVGRGVLAAAISRNSAIMSQTNPVIMTYGNHQTGQQFLYYPAYAKRALIKFPHFVTPGGGSFVDIGFRYLNADQTDQEITFRMT